MKMSRKNREQIFKLFLLLLNMENQKQIWNSIAPEWYKFKIEKSNPETIKFLKSQETKFLGTGKSNSTKFSESQKGKVLDLGSGSGRYLTKIKNGEMYLVDFSEEMIKLAEQHSKEKKIPAKFFVSEMNHLPFEDEFFDAAIANSSFHCIEKKQQEKVARELYRVLKPKAKAEISVWNINSKRFKNSPKEKYISWRDKGKRYYYLFDEEELINLLKKVGFKIIKKQIGIMITIVVEK